MIVEVLGIQCVVISTKVPIEIAHPGESMEGTHCEHCVIVERPDTKEPVLAWGFKTGDFTVSRHDRNFKRHRAAFERM